MFQSSPPPRRGCAVGAANTPILADEDVSILTPSEKGMRR